ncbi:hypothetical protein V6N12_045119 [Hibiscus sabdariffa]|uniref:Uncharacterized protein n=1 Tax=Hibiscus sabdariffa TaxID=183260 RepID=A0ABR2G1T7_9ROSI
MPIEKWTAPAGAWFLLSEVSVYLLKAVDWEFLHHHWQLLYKHGAKGKFQSPRDRVFFLQTISSVSIELPAADLAHNLLKRVEKYISDNKEPNTGNSFFTPPSSGSRKKKGAATVSRLLSKAVTAVYAVGSLVVVCPTADTAPFLYTEAWLTLGKCCLVDGKLAKSYIPLFVQV